MKFVQVDENIIREKGLHVSDIFNTLNDFQSSGFKCVKLEGYPHKTAAGCATSFRHGIKRYKRFHIKVMVRQNEVYLINTLLDK